MELLRKLVQAKEMPSVSVSAGTVKRCGLENKAQVQVADCCLCSKEVLISPKGHDIHKWLHDKPEGSLPFAFLCEVPDSFTFSGL